MPPSAVSDFDEIAAVLFAIAAVKMWADEASLAEILQPREAQIGAAAERLGHAMSAPGADRSAAAVQWLERLLSPAVPGTLRTAVRRSLNARTGSGWTFEAAEVAASRAAALEALIERPGMRRLPGICSSMFLDDLLGPTRRRRATLAEVALPPSESVEPGFVAECEAEDFSARFLAMLRQRLTPAERRQLQAVLDDPEATAGDIARSMDCAVGTVWARTSAIRRKATIVLKLLAA